MNIDKDFVGLIISHILSDYEPFQHLTWAEGPRQMRNDKWEVRYLITNEIISNQDCEKAIEILTEALGLNPLTKHGPVNYYKLRTSGDTEEESKKILKALEAYAIKMQLIVPRAPHGWYMGNMNIEIAESRLKTCKGDAFLMVRLGDTNDFIYSVKADDRLERVFFKHQDFPGLAQITPHVLYSSLRILPKMKRDINQKRKEFAAIKDLITLIKQSRRTQTGFFNLLAIDNLKMICAASVDLIAPAMAEQIFKTRMSK